MIAGELVKMCVADAVGIEMIFEKVARSIISLRVDGVWGAVRGG
jgi:hypothetical protein